MVRLVSSDELRVVDFLITSLKNSTGTVVQRDLVQKFWVERGGEDLHFAHLRFNRITSSGIIEPEATGRRWHLFSGEGAVYGRLVKNLVTNGIYTVFLDEEADWYARTVKANMEALKREGVNYVPGFGVRRPDAADTVRGPITAATRIQKHRVDARQIPHKTGSTLPEVGVACECDRGYWCPQALEWFKSSLVTSAIRQQLGVTDKAFLALPLFGKVLHRIEITIRSEKDWEGIPSEELVLTTTTFRDDEMVKIFRAADIDEGLVHPFEELRRFIEDDFITDGATTYAIDAAHDFRTRTSQVHGCTLSSHRYGSTKRLLDFLNEDPGSIGAMNSVLAHAFTVLCYRCCYICYESRELAFLNNPTSL